MLVHTLTHYSTYTTMAHSLTYMHAHTQIYAHDRQCRKFLLLTDIVGSVCQRNECDVGVPPCQGIRRVQLMEEKTLLNCIPFYFQKSSITCPGKMVFVPTDMIINISIHLDASFLTNHKDLPVTSNTSHAD